MSLPVRFRGVAMIVTRDEKTGLPTWMNQREIADFLLVHSSTIFKWRREGIFPEPDFVMGKKLRRWKLETVLNFVRDHRGLLGNVGYEKTEM
jgi:hypothetical protein